MTSYRESVVSFGEHNNLTGVITEPTEAGTKQPWVVMLNAGVLHHAGPFRMNTDLARALAEHGISSLRMDFSGIGDSDLGGSSAAAEERYVLEMQAAFDTLDNHSGGHNHYVVMGLCTGADNAHKAAVHDERVTGAICLDGYAYPTWKYRIKNLAPRIARTLLSPKKLWNQLARRLKPRQTSPALTDDYLFRWHLPDKATTVAEWQRLGERGVRLLMIYTSGSLASYNYRGQFFDAAPSLKAYRHQFQVAMYPQADHTFTLVGDRQALFQDLITWLQAGT